MHLLKNNFIVIKQINIFLLVFIAFLYADKSIAQPNGGFENWTTEFSYENPDGWQTLNFLSLTSPPNPLSAFKAIGIDKHSGNYALQLKTIYVNNNPLAGLLGDTTGGVFTGKINLSPVTWVYGLSYTDRPEKLNFWAKYNPVGNDSAGIVVFLKKWNGVSADTVGLGKIKLSPTPVYTFFEIFIDYYMEEIPDSAVIGFSPSYDFSTARVNSILYVDDVQLTGWVGIDETKKKDNYTKVFPNPAKDNVIIQTSFKDACNVRIIDISGKPVADYILENGKVNINIHLFDTGLYLYQISDREKRVLTRGKYNVIK